MFLLAGFRSTNLRGITDLALDSQLLKQVHKPLHWPDGFFDANQHWARELG